MNFTKLQYFLESLDTFDVHEFDISIKVNHKEIYRYMYGFSDPERTKHINNKNLRWIYSMSKVITVTAALRLVEKQIISLNDKVSKYLPEFDNLKIKSKGNIVNSTKPLLVKHLFSMRSGLDYNIYSNSIIQAKISGKNTTRDLVRAMANEPLNFEPGTEFMYSLSHDVLAALVEVVTQKSWYEYLKDEIFTPLEMYNIGFHPTSEQKELFTQKYEYDSNKFRCKISDMNNIYCLTDTYQSGGAGLFSSTDDYMKVIDALANFGTAANGYQLLKPSTVELLRTNQVPENGCVCKDGYGYALGVRTLVDKNLARSLSPIGEFGWDGAANSYCLVDPEHKLTIGFFTHIFGTGFFNEIISPKIRNIVYEELKI